jgi:hypothetical protein
VPSVGEHPIVVSTWELHFWAMQRTLTYVRLSSSLEGNPNLNVVIAYEDFETGKHAKKTCDFLAENLGDNCRVSNQMWKFDVLGIPKLREMAAKDAAHADIVIVSCHGSNDLPVEVKAWIELWMADQSNTVALVALFDSPADDPQQANSIRDYLTGVANRGQMEFFVQPYDTLVRRKEPPHGRRRPSSPLDEEALFTLSGVVQQDRSFPRWGINE